MITKSSDQTLSLAQAKVKRNAVQQQIEQLRKKIEVHEEELRRFDWLINNFFSPDKTERSVKRKNAREIVEEILRETGEEMAPVEIYEEALKKGYTGNKTSIYTRLFKWVQKGNTNIVRIRNGRYAHKSVAHHFLQVP